MSIATTTSPIMGESINQKVTKEQDILSYSPGELSAAIGVSTASLCRDREDGCRGGIPFVRFGSRILYPKNAVIDWLNSKVERGSPVYAGAVPLQGRQPGRPIGTTKVELKKRQQEVATGGAV